LNPFAKAVTWDWVRKNMETLRELFRGTPNVSFLLQDVISRTGIGREDVVKEYLSKTTIEEADQGIRKGLELLEAYSSLAERLARQK